MIHTENERYSLIYNKSYQKTLNTVRTYIPTTWHVEDENSSVVWAVKGKLTPDQKQEIRKKFNLIVKVN